MLAVAYVIALRKERLREALFLGVTAIGVVIHGAGVYSYYEILSGWLPKEAYGTVGIMSFAQYEGVSYMGEFFVLYLPWVSMFAFVIAIRRFLLRKKNINPDAGFASPLDVGNTRQYAARSMIWPNFVSIGVWFHILFLLFGFIGRYQNPLSVQYVLVLLAISICLDYLDKQIDEYFTYKYWLVHLQCILALTTIFAMVQSVFVRVTPISLICVGLVFSALFRYIRYHIRHLDLSLFREVIFAVLVGLIVSFPHLLSCFTRVYDLGFDSQNYLTWFYAASRGFRPNIDIFYLYGYLTYFAEGLAWARVLLWIYISILFVIYFFLIKKMFQSSGLAYVLFGVLLVLISANSYLWAFYRYGTAPAMIGLFAWALTKDRKYNKYAIIVLGIISSALYFLLTDQGVVLIMASLVVILVDSTTSQSNIKKNTNPLSMLVKQGARYMVGLSLGASIFVIPLIQQGVMSQFLGFVVANSKITLYGKLTYFSSGLAAKDVLISGSIWIAIILVAYRYIFHSNKFRFMQSYALLGAVCVLGIIQYKNTTRAIDNDVLIPLYFMILCACSMVCLALKERKIRQEWLVLWAVGCIMFCFSSSLSYSKIVRGMTVLKDSYSVSRVRMTGPRAVEPELAQCMRRPLSALPKTGMEAYFEVVRWVNSQVGFNGKIFSYPGDPIFYVLLGQKPPPIFNAYDATPKASQEQNIDYIHRNNVQYIVFNTTSSSFMDGVPNMVRNAYIHKYIFTHYEPVVMLGQFVIMKKTQGEHDVLASSVQLNHEFLDELTNIDLRRIPKSEGSKLEKHQSDWKSVGTSPKSLDDLQTELRTNRLYSKNLALLVSFNSFEGLSEYDVTMQVMSGNMVTNVKFEACVYPAICMIHLDRLPLFYVNKPVTKIVLDRPTYRDLRFVEVINDDIFW
jgi:hypothetical protein